MAKKTALFFAFALSCLLAAAQAARGGLIEGDNWAFLVSAPVGWIWDSTALRLHGIRGLFYKAGTEFSPSRLHIYISPTRKRPGGPASLNDFIKQDETAFMGTKPGTNVTDLSPYAPGMDYVFVLKDYDDTNEGYYQAIAYYEGEDAYFVFVLSGRSAQERESERASFHELLDSFTYIHKEE